MSADKHISPYPRKYSLQDEYGYNDGDLVLKLNELIQAHNDLVDEVSHINTQTIVFDFIDRVAQTGLVSNATLNILRDIAKQS